jgi:hypothetical protein
MKFKMLIVDLEMPRSVRKWALPIGIATSVLLGGGVAAAAAGLVTFSDGQPLHSADLNTNFNYLQSEISALQNSTPANDTMANLQLISATVTGANGGTATTSCPSGYNLVMASVDTVVLTQSGTWGWANGTYGCNIVSGQLVASLTNFANGSSYSTFACQGLCAK